MSSGRWSKPLSPAALERIKVEHRFREKVVKVGDCWLWQGATYRGSRGGPLYGLFRSADGGLVGAHRWAYYHWRCSDWSELDGFDVGHDCPLGETLCVNPWHLVKQTHQENMEQAARERHLAKSLDDRTVLDIDARLRRGESIRAIAKAVDAGRATVNSIGLGAGHAPECPIENRAARECSVVLCAECRYAVIGGHHPDCSRFDSTVIRSFTEALASITWIC